MIEIETEVLIVGSGPAGLSAALALSMYGVRTTIVTRHRWLAHTPRAHVTNQRTFEVFRDLGVEAEVNAQATSYERMPDAVFCTSLSGEELARIRIFGSNPQSSSNYVLSSPCQIADISQDLLEPILLGKAVSGGANIRFNTEYLSSVQDRDGVTSTVQDRVSGEHLVIRSKYLIGADGGNSKVARDLDLPMQGEMNLSGSLNILFEADLASYVEYRPAALYFLVRTGLNTDGVGLGFLRPIQGWNRWLLTKGYILGQAVAKLTDAEAVEIVRDYIGDASLAVRIKAIDPWTLNSMHATRYSKGRVFCVGDAVHRHVPSNGLGSNTSIQDSYNLAWKLAFVLQCKADPSLLDSYEEERVPVGQQVVQRATKSLESYGPILATLGLVGAESPEQGAANMEGRKAATVEATAQREQFRMAIAAKSYEFNAHGVEMNQRYCSSAIVTDGFQPRSYPLDQELYYLPTTCPGSRLPHAWLQRGGRSISTLDLVGKGRFTVITGIGGEVWISAALAVAEHFGLPIEPYIIGPGCTLTDLYHEWSELREVAESGCLLVRPDGHVAWRAHQATASADDAKRELSTAISQILGRTLSANTPILQDHQAPART
jgi:2,4-dichlorophenol 6-monooxygenase